MKPNAIAVTDDAGNVYTLKTPDGETGQLWHSDFIANNGDKVRIGVYFQAFTPEQWDEYYRGRSKRN